MEAIQLPLSNLHDVLVEGMPDFIIKSGNSMQCAFGAAVIAKTTGSIGASEFRTFPTNPPDFKDNGIRDFAIVTRVKK